MAKVADKADIKQAQASLLALGANLERKVPSAVEDEVDALIESIEDKIVQKGLVGDPSDKPGQPPLVASFKESSSGSSRWTIYSTAEHAMALEEGADPHRIEPKNAVMLSWVPENPSDYPKKGDPDRGKTYYDPDSGMVFSTGVDHPGNDEYAYITEAQAAWAPIAHVQIEESVKDAIVEAGFKPSGGGGGRLGSDPDFLGGGLF
jgi:hypothetical protein